jgi:archaeosortase B (VPXXXP-CTERM-specific)
MTVQQQGAMIIRDPVQIEIIYECTGVFSIMVLSSCILAYPTKLKEKIIGLVLIIPLILLMNLARLLVLLYVGSYHMDLFEFVHSFLWQATFIIFIIFSWLLWIELVVQR